MTRAALQAIAGRWSDAAGIPTVPGYRYDVEHARAVARWYLGDVEPFQYATPYRAARRRWARLGGIISAQFADISQVLTITVTADDPYADADEMRADVERGRLAIMATDPGSHPLWSDDQNNRFRAVHDALGHATNGVGFDRFGEDVAYLGHASTMPTDVLGALACETRGQNAALVYGHDIDGRPRGTFAAQACVTAPKWIWAAGLVI